jgi:hypothetical protein
MYDVRISLLELRSDRDLVRIGSDRHVRREFGAPPKEGPSHVTSVGAFPLNSQNPSTSTYRPNSHFVRLDQIRLSLNDDG